MPKQHKNLKKALEHPEEVIELQLGTPTLKKLPAKNPEKVCEFLGPMGVSIAFMIDAKTIQHRVLIGKCITRFLIDDALAREVWMMASSCHRCASLEVSGRETSAHSHSSPSCFCNSSRYRSYVPIN